MSLPQNKKEYLLDFLRELNNQIFEFSFGSFFTFRILDEILNKGISKYFNINIFLITLIFSVLVTIIFNYIYKKETAEKIYKRDYLLIFILGIILSLNLYQKIEVDKRLQLLISIMGGIIFIVFSLALINYYKQKDL